MTTDTNTTVRINPSSWSGYFRYDQAQLRPAPVSLLTLAGQGPIDATGTLRHADDPAAQVGAAMDNVIELLTAGGMDLNDVTRMVIYTTDLDATFAAYSQITDRLDVAGATPPATLVGVTRLAVPGMTVEIEVTAAR